MNGIKLFFSQMVNTWQAMKLIENKYVLLSLKIAKKDLMKQEHLVPLTMNDLNFYTSL